MRGISKIEVDKIAKQYITLRRKALKSKDIKVLAEFKEFQNYCIEKLSYLVTGRTSRYRQFSNYQDLTQDGFEALILALKTYKPRKGCFVWWAHKYIDTRVSRAANAHSTIRYPLKKAKKLNPHKVSGLPLMLDPRDPLENTENAEIRDKVLKAVYDLPEDQKNIILLAFGFSVAPSDSVNFISKELSMSRTTCVKLLDMAKENLKTSLFPLI